MALKFTGDNVIDLLDSEQSVLGFSEVDNKPLQTSNGFKALPLAPANLLSSTDVSRASLSVLTVSKIRERVTATSNKTA